MVMGRREGVAHASWPITATDLGVLSASFAAALARVPLRRRLWARGGPFPESVAIAVTRETIRTFMGSASSLPIEEWRSVELFLGARSRHFSRLHGRATL